MIPDETVERVRESADIVQVIGEYVQLRRMGTDYRGPCPFHQGTHRNFSVSPRKRMYYCFVCHEGGDVFNFVQKRLGLDWPAAVRLVAEKSGIEVQEVETRREGSDTREPLWEVCGAAAEYFRGMLWDSEQGADARAYLESRRIPREVADRFGLGFAPREIGLLRAYLNTLGFEDERLLETGLLVRPDEGSEPRPRFRGRLVFPIFDALGRPVGFGGRLLGPGEPKYLNSPETAIFSKGKLLYGLNWAKLAARREERLLIVEGYFDVVRLAAAGIEEVVAPLGTSLTEAQATLVRRYAPSVFLLYDSDAAGLKATFRAGDELLRQDLSVQVVTLPEGEDPDTFVDKHGADALRAQLAAALDVFERKIQILERAGWFGDLRKRRRAIDRLLPTIRATSDPVTRDLYLSRASEVSGVSRETLLDELRARTETPRESAPQRSTGPVRRVEAGPGAPGGEGADGGPPPDVHEPVGRWSTERRGGPRRRFDRRDRPEPLAIRGSGNMTSRGERVERELLRVLLHVPTQMERVVERIGPDNFRNGAYRAIFAALLEHAADVPPESLAEAVAGALDASAVRVLQDELLSDPAGMLDPAGTVDGCLVKLRERDLDEQLLELDRRIQSAEGNAKDALIVAKERLRDEKKALGGRSFKKYGK